MSKLDYKDRGYASLGVHKDTKEEIIEAQARKGEPKTIKDFIDKVWGFYKNKYDPKNDN